MLFGDSRLAQFNPFSKSFFYLIVFTPLPPPLIFGVLQVALVMEVSDNPELLPRTPHRRAKQVLSYRTVGYLIPSCSR